MESRSLHLLPLHEWPFWSTPSVCHLLSAVSSPKLMCRSRLAIGKASVASPRRMQRLSSSWLDWTRSTIDQRCASVALPFSLPSTTRHCRCADALLRLQESQKNIKCHLRNCRLCTKSLPALEQRTLSGCKALHDQHQMQRCMPKWTALTPA